MKLLKFRSLNKYNYTQICDIIQNQKFWMSNIWNLNDSMEGVYSSILKQEYLDKIFSNKNKYKICSFSHGNEIDNSLLWGYYANGYRGIAIQVEINDESKLKKINYDEDNKIFENLEDINIVDIITSKNKNWEKENEYRYLLEESEEGYYKIGKIIKIYFGNPHGHLNNRKKIEDNSNEYKKYNELSNKLKDFCDKNNIEWGEVFPKI